MKNFKQVSKISISGFVASTFPATFLALNAFATGGIFSGGVQGGADKGRGEGVPTQLFGEGISIHACTLHRSKYVLCRARLYVCFLEIMPRIFSDGLRLPGI